MIIILNNNKTILKKKSIKLKTIINKNENYISINNVISDNKKLKKKNTSIFFLNNDNKKNIKILRHSCAHLLAHSIQNIYKNVFFLTGPVIKNGFYYDFFCNKNINENDLIKIEKEMIFLSKKSIDIKKYIIKKNKAKELFKNNKYKLKILNKIKNDYVKIYKQETFIDLCKGPHVKNTNKITNFKLIKITKLYNKKELIYRIYGITSSNENYLKKKINDYATKKINHKDLGKNLFLFDFDKNSSGVIFWNKNGWMLYSNIKNYIQKYIKKNNYKEVNTPILLEKNLFEKSGHIKKFNKNMFTCTINKKTYVLKPMNCPCHINIFNNFSKKSYKDLPLKISEFGSCFRNEISGSIYGLMRLKNFTQDDAHIFCSEKQIINEIKLFILELKNIYYSFGFKRYKIVISKRPKNITKNKKTWQIAEHLLEKSLKILKLKYSTSNDGAFYGPKLEFSLKDNLNRIWQCGTIQIDFFTAKKLNATYIDKNGNFKNPIILHRAILGSIERFIGILLENKNGKIPFFITPIKFDILYINNKQIAYSKLVYEILKKRYNVRLIINNERLEQKIKKCILEKIQYIIILGYKEYITNTISIRKINSKEFKNISINKILLKIKLNAF